MTKPLAIDLFCGLFGWSEGLVAEGWRVVGFDLEDMHANFGITRRPEFQLVIQDCLTLHGSQFRDAALIVASPPCQEFSYMSMPWSLAKAKAAAIRADTTGAARAELTKLFDACFRIQREACAAAGRHIPMVVENVRGAQEWVGPARWNFGSFYLYGDVPALMPPTFSRRGQPGTKSAGPTWDEVKSGKTQSHWTNPAEHEGIKQGGSGAAWWRDALNERRREGTAIKNGNDWFGSGEDCSLQRKHGSKSTGCKAAAAMIARIPLSLSRHVARVYSP